MIALISFLLVVGMSLFVVKLGSIALQATGLSKDVADFQAQSAFSGVGFTTSESESIVNNPVRRKILRILMLLGSAGLTTAVATLVLTFTSDGNITLFGYTFNDNALLDILIIFTFMWFLFGVSRMHWFEHLLKWMFRVPLERLKQKVYLYDYEHLLALSKGYAIATFEVLARHWMANKTIGQLRIKKQGVVVLGISRRVHDKEEFIGSPSLPFTIKAGDKITMYGQQDTITDIATRPLGPKGTKKANEAVKKAKILKDIKKLDEKRLRELSEIGR